MLHLTVLGVPPASSDKKNNKKKIQIVRPTFTLHLTV